MFDHVNWVAVLGAAIVAFAIGAIWYGPLFGKRWAGLIGMGMGGDGGSVMVPLAINFLMGLVGATALAVLVTPFAKDALTAAFVGALVWVASGLAVKLNDLTFARRPVALFYIDSLGHLISLVVMAIIVSTFRV
ncbi:MAG: DUF1761 domain-containing protein [Chloroflexi bacterium]|nr:DUF1761 domain-containing protein [Chloroflexota bacterium]